MNKNTKQSRAIGMSNLASFISNGQQVTRNAEPIFKGADCNTAWDAPASKHKSPKKFREPKSKN